MHLAPTTGLYAGMSLTTRTDLWRRATSLIPGGVNSPVRAMRSVGLDEPVFVARGDGALVEDVDGDRYVDWVQSWGPLIFGHADPETLAAVPRRGRPRDDVRRADRGRGRARGRDRRRRAVGRDGPARELGHRGVDEHPPARARRHAPRPGDQVRRVLPRPRRRAPRERGLGDDDARAPLDPGCAGRRHGRHDRLRLQRRRRRRGCLRAVRGRPRRDPRRARRREHGLRPARARLPRDAAARSRTRPARYSSSTR